LSSLALMRWLESAPGRYDTGMRAVTLGRITRLHDAVARAAAPAPGARVLEIGCGSGAVTERLIARAARVTVVEQNPEMLQAAQSRLAAGDSDQHVEWLERTASEVDALDEAAFDAVVLSLVLSEMSGSERAFVLHAAAQRLTPRGRVVAADEVMPARPVHAMVFRLLRAPQALAGWLLVGSVSRPLGDLRGELECAGLDPVSEERWLGGSLALQVAEKRP